MRAPARSASVLCPLWPAPGGDGHPGPLRSPLPRPRTARLTAGFGVLPARALAGEDAVDVVDAVDALHGRQHRLEVGGVGQLEVEVHGGDAIGGRVAVAAD